MQRMKSRILAGLAILCTALWMVTSMVDLAEARVGGGRSSGFRGSRSAAPPRQMTTPPAYKPTPAPPPAPAAPGPQQPRPGLAGPAGSTPAPASSGWGSFGRGLAGGLAGGLIGGMIGNMLFGGSHGAGAAGAPVGGSGCGSFGLFDLLVVGGLLYLGYRLLNRRRPEGPMTASSAAPVSIPATWQDADKAELPAYNLVSVLDAIRRTDPSFDEAAFKDFAQDVFFKLQGAWMRQDVSLIRDLVTPELFDVLSRDLEELKAKGQINRLENIAVRQVEITEAWQEQGLDYLTVGFFANLLDYTVDAKTNAVVAGSNTEPIKFEEYWTFVRPSGSGPWKLSAITQPEG
jgi:predicted lipid-binding transport protein (Tim44 family)